MHNEVKSVKGIFGNREAKRIMEGMFERDELPPCILFYGMRGTGKSTCAKLIASHFTHPNSIVTLNIADTGGKSDMQDIIREAMSPPLLGRFKIFILNEFQGASPKGQDALLEILENPPIFTRFILTSTDPQKFKDTILSRCVKIHMRPLDYKDFKFFLKKKKGVLQFTLTEEFMSDLYDLTEGCPRDILNALEAVRECPDTKSARNMLSSMPTLKERKFVFDIINSLMANESLEKIIRALKLAMQDIKNSPEKYRVLLQRALVRELLDSSMLPFYKYSVHKVLVPLLGNIFTCEADVVYAVLEIREVLETVSKKYRADKTGY